MSKNDLRRATGMGKTAVCRLAGFFGLVGCLLSPDAVRAQAISAQQLPVEGSASAEVGALQSEVASLKKELEEMKKQFGTIMQSPLASAAAGGSGAPITLSAPLRIVDGSGQPLMEVRKASGGAALVLFASSGAERVVVGAANADVGWGLVLNDSGGSPQASLGDKSGAVGLRVYEAGTEVLWSGNSSGKGAAVDVYTPSSRGAVAQLHANPDGSGSVQVFDSGGQNSVMLDGKTKTVSVDSDKGVASLGDDDDGFGLHLGDSGGEALAELAQPSGKGMGLRIFNGASQVAAIGRIPGDGGAVYIFDDGGMPAAALDTLDGGGVVRAYKSGRKVTAALVGSESKVAVYNEAGTGVAALGLASSGSGGNVTATDPGGQGVFSAGYTPDGPGTDCVLHTKGGVKCLGIGLTGMEGMH